MTSKSDLASGLHEYPEVYGIHTHVIKYGSLDDNKRLVLVIPGRSLMKLINHEEMTNTRLFQLDCCSIINNSMGSKND